MGERSEQRLVQQLVAQFPVERFVGAILPRLPRIDEGRFDAGLVQPPQGLLGQGAKQPHLRGRG